MVYRFAPETRRSRLSASSRPSTITWSLRLLTLVPKSYACDQNGTQTNTTTGASLNFAADTQATLGNLDFGRQYLRGDIAEVLVYSGASAIQQAAVETYLMQKYFGAASVRFSRDEEIDLTPYLGSLTTGTNVLAIAGLNTSASDSDFLIRPELIGAPGAQQYAARRPDESGWAWHAGPLTPTEASQLAATWNTQSFTVYETVAQ